MCSNIFSQKLIAREQGLFKDRSVFSLMNYSKLDTVLNDIGQQQSRLVAKAVENVPFTHVFCSPLKRATQVTAPHESDLMVDLG
jgi:hypothetical protein